MYLAFQTVSFAQCDLSISGRVLDEHDNEPLAFAQVFIPKLNVGAVVDSSGYYRIDNLCPGVYEVIASHIGCLPVHRKITLTTSVNGFDFFPKHHRTELKEVKLHTLLLTIKKTYTDAAQNDSLNTSNANLINLDMPALRVQQTGATILKPIIRAYSGNRININKQGVDIQDQQWGTDHGVSVAFYPDDKFYIEDMSLSGLGFSRFSLLPNNPFSKKMIFFTSAFSNGRGGQVGFLKNSRLNKSSAIGFRAQLNKQGSLSAPDYNLTNTAAEFANAQLDFRHIYKTWELISGLSYNYQKSGILRASHVGNADDFQRAIEAEIPDFTSNFSYDIDFPRQASSHLLFSSELQQKKQIAIPNSTRTLQQLLAFYYNYQLNSRQEFDIRRGGDSDIPALDLRLQTHNFGAKWKRPLNNLRQIEFDVEQSFGINTNIPGTGFEPVLPNYNVYTSILNAQYSQFTRRISGRLRVGAHFQYQHLLAQYFEGENLVQIPFDFTTGALVTSFEKIWVRMKQNSSKTKSEFSSFTRFSLKQRAPSPNELLVSGVHHGTASIEEGNPNLQMETAIGFNQTFSYDLKGKLKLTASLYANYVDNFIYQIPLPTPRLTIRGAFPVFAFNQNDALLSGAELTLDYKLFKDVHYSFGLNYIYGEDLNKQTPLPLIPPLQNTQSISYKTDFSKVWQNAFIKLEGTYVAEQSRFDPQLDLASAPKAYTLFNLAMGVDISKKQIYGIGLRIENITNQSYRNYLDRFRYFADAPGTNVLLELLVKF